MIKKVIACLTICFIITGIISPVFSDASALPQPNWSDPGISEIINISDLTGWMLNGGTFDVSQYTDAESFMNDYFNARTKTRLISPGEAAEDYYEVLPGFGINNQLVAGDSFARPLDTNRVIASSFRDHTGYGRRLSNEVNDALLSSGNLYDTKIPLLNEVEFANFVNYNHDALRLYSEFFSNSSDPGPNPDPDYLTFINIANNNQAYGFFWQNLPLNWSEGSYDYISLCNPSNDHSWFCGNSFDIFQYANNGLMVDNSNLKPSTQILTLNITNVDNSYTGVITGITSQDSYRYVMFGHQNYVYYLSDLRYSSLNTFYSFTQQSIRDTQNYNGITNQSCSFTGSLYEVMSYFCNRFKNINIYVDGQLWALAGTPEITPTITPEFPDAVGGDDLPSTTWPIFRPRAPYYTNVPGVLQAIEDAIADDGELDIDDLKPYLTDENGDPVPDPIFDPEPVPIPIPDPVNPDVVPGLPVLPAISPEMPGFNGVSVLAEIINFTNQSLPTSLIVTFWGIVFGIVILGLIKILHK